MPANAKRTRHTPQSTQELSSKELWYLAFKLGKREVTIGQLVSFDLENGQFIKVANGRSIRMDRGLTIGTKPTNDNSPYMTEMSLSVISTRGQHSVILKGRLYGIQEAGEGVRVEIYGPAQYNFSEREPVTRNDIRDFRKVHLRQGPLPEVA